MLKLIGQISLFLALTLRLPGQSTDWPLFRGHGDLSGKCKDDLPLSPRLLWNTATAFRTKSSPVISEGWIYFGNDKGYLFAVGTDGKVQWKYETGSPIETPPMISGKKVIFGSDDGVLRAVDKKTGRFLWSYKTDNKIVGSANVWSSGGKTGIVIGSYDYFLHCVNAESGKLMWKIETENYVNGTPAILNGKVVFGGCDGFLRVVDPVGGRQLFSIEIGVYIASSPALSGESAYFGDYDGNIYCVNLKSRKITWKVTAGEASILAIPALGNNYAVIGSEDNNLYCYDARDGRLIWKYRTNDRITGSAVISSSLVLSAGTDGIVNIIRLDSGEKVWSFNAGAPVSSSPAVVKGCFYILAEDGRLMAFGEE